LFGINNFYYATTFSNHKPKFHAVTGLHAQIGKIKRVIGIFLRDGFNHQVAIPQHFTIKAIPRERGIAFHAKRYESAG